MNVIETSFKTNRRKWFFMQLVVNWCCFLTKEVENAVSVDKLQGD